MDGAEDLPKVSPWENRFSSVACSVVTWPNVDDPTTSMAAPMNKPSTP